MNETLLIKNCQDGESTAQRKLYDKYFTYVYTISFRYLKHHQDAEDVVSESFNRVFRNIVKFKDSSNNGLKRWIQTITINEALRFINKKQPIVYTDDDDLLDDYELVPESNFEGKIHLIKELIEKMPEGYRRIFLLQVVEGLSHSEIGEFLGISRNTSKSQLLKARKYLQTELRNYESRQIR